MADVVPVRRALLSVSDKQGLIELARVLADRGVHLLASGGTRTALAEAGLEVTEVADYTGQPEILGGRVKTLHPKIHGGILARRDVPERPRRPRRPRASSRSTWSSSTSIPFEATIARPGVTFEEAIENIDIGGPSLIRGAAKNHAHVAVLTDPDQYADADRPARRRTAGRPWTFRRRWPPAVFERTAPLRPRRSPTTSAPRSGRAPSRRRSRPRSTSASSCGQSLRYGENPHQRAAFYVEPGTGRARTWRPPRSGTARSCRTTTCSTSTAPCG